MAENKHTIGDLYQMQALSLRAKITMTKERIRGWLAEFDAYVSFSGGKDSTVLLDIARQIDADIPAVFVDTGLEYPEIRNFVKTFDNVTWLKPKMNFRQVIEKYGYPFISKEVSECVYGAKRYLTKLKEKASLDQTDRQTDHSLPYWYRYEKLLGLGEFSNNIMGGVQLDTNQAINNYRVQRLMDILPKQGMATVESIPENKNKSMYSCKKYAYFLDAEFDISNACCNVMKKSPAKAYTKETGRKPITAQMASESKLRTQQWLKNGCNGFNMKSPISNPMSFWTEEDVLAYIKIFNLPICSVYGDIVIDDGTLMGKPIESTDGWLESGMFDNVRPPLKTTGCSRTGCVFCGYGCHLEKDGEGRFERLKVTHPQLYDYLMRPWEEEVDDIFIDEETGEEIPIKRKIQGLNYKKVIDWINEHGNLHIKY